MVLLCPRPGASVVGRKAAERLLIAKSFLLCSRRKKVILGDLLDQMPYLELVLGVDLTNKTSGKNPRRAICVIT